MVVGKGSNQQGHLYPPCWDIAPTEGAVSYRFDIASKSGGSWSFTADQPWRPLTPVWNELPPLTSKNAFTLVVTPVDADGKDLPGPMRLGIRDKKTRAEVRIERPAIYFQKRDPFIGAGPTQAHNWQAAALACDRFCRDGWHMGQERGNSVMDGGSWSASGDSSFGPKVAGRIWSRLAGRALSTDPYEVLHAESVLDLHYDELAAHMGGEPRVIYAYQNITTLNHWPLTALCDAFRQTGDERWAELARLAGAGVAAVQADDGSFYDEHRMSGPRETWRGGKGFARTWSTAELLYAFGRLRRDLGLEDFAEVERKAWEWALVGHVQDRNFPLHVSHSAAPSYPITQHPVAALMLARYMLECAPEDRRDLSLAEDLCRWAEDHRIDWGNSPDTGPDSRIYPRIPDGDRYNNAPLLVNLLAAIVFEELGRAKGDELWRAKGRALANAATQAISPDRTKINLQLASGVDPGLTPIIGKTMHWYMSVGWAAQLFREYGALVDETAAP